MSFSPRGVTWKGSMTEISMARALLPEQSHGSSLLSLCLLRTLCLHLTSRLFFLGYDKLILILWVKHIHSSISLCSNTTTIYRWSILLSNSQLPRKLSQHLHVLSSFATPKSSEIFSAWTQSASSTVSVLQHNHSTPGQAQQNHNTMMSKRHRFHTPTPFPDHTNGMPPSLAKQLMELNTILHARFDVTEFNHTLRMCYFVPPDHNADFLQHFHVAVKMLDAINRDSTVRDCFQTVTGCTEAEVRILAMRYLFVLREWAYIARSEDEDYTRAINGLFLNRLVQYREWGLSVPGDRKFGWGEYAEFQSANEKLCAWVRIPWYEPDQK